MKYRRVASAIWAIAFAANCCSLGRCDENSPSWRAPRREAEKQNPIPAEPASIARGKALYAGNCVVCHGPSGKGDGPKAIELNLKPSDLSSSHVAGESDGALYWKITSGHSPMPAFQKMIADEERWNVVNYLRTLGPARQPEDAKPAAYAQERSTETGTAPGQKKSSTPADPQAITRGKRLYDSHCAACHGPNGKGDGPKGKDLDPTPSDLSAARVAARSDGKIFSLITEGRKPMPAFKNELSDQDRSDVVSFVRTLSPAARPSKGVDTASMQNAPARAREGPASSSADDQDRKDDETERGPNHFVRWIGHFHPPLTAFPIALLLTAAMAELLRLLKGPAWLDGASRWCVIVGAASAVVTAPLGWAFATERAASWILEVHRWLGTAAAAGAVTLLILSEVARRRGGCWVVLFRVVLFAAVPLVAATGFFGGAMVYGLHAYQWKP